MSKDEATWAQIRRAYEAGDETVSTLAKRFEVSAGTIYRHARKCGWASRSKQPGTASRERKKADEASHSISDGSARLLPGKQPDARRKTTKRKPRRKISRTRLIERLYNAIDAKLSRLEQRMQADQDLSAADSERETRELSTMIRSFEKVAALAGQDQEQSGSSAKPARETTGQGDAERMREEIARRLERLWTSDDPQGPGATE